MPAFPHCVGMDATVLLVVVVDVSNVTVLVSTTKDVATEVTEVFIVDVAGAIC